MFFVGSVRDQCAADNVLDKDYNITETVLIELGDICVLSRYARFYPSGTLSRSHHHDFCLYKKKYI